MRQFRPRNGNEGACHARSAPASKRFFFRGLAWLILVLLIPGSGCRAVKTAVDAPGMTLRAVPPGKESGPPVDPVDVQQTLLRLAEEFSVNMVSGVERLRRGTNNLDRAEELRWQTALGSEICSIASGPNAVANLLDMAVFVTVTRAAIEEYWRPNVFGDSALPMLESCRDAETNAWRSAVKVLRTEEVVEFRRAIEEWRRQNPQPESVFAARALGLASRVSRAPRAATGKPGSVFNLLMLDPLSGLDPATREIAQTRMFAERALYVAQKMPMLVRWQTELLAVNAMETPTVRQLVTNSTTLSASVDRVSRAAEELPGRIVTEGEEILRAVRSQEKELTPLVNEVRQALESAARMSTSLNTTLMTFDALMKRFGVGETNTAGTRADDTEPFRVQDYGRTAAQVDAAARQLTELLRTLDRTLGSTNLAQLSAQADPVVRQAQAGGREIVDYAFRRCLELLGAVLVGALAYRAIASRLVARRGAAGIQVGKL